MAEVEGECSCISARVLHLVMMDVLLMSCHCSFLHCDDDAILPAATTGTRNICLFLLFEIGSLLAMVVVSTANKDSELYLGNAVKDSEWIGDWRLEVREEGR